MSAAAARGFPREALPEVALVGRSNVGKSSLINALTRRSIARTSAAPGKTRLANFYRVRLATTKHGDRGPVGSRSVYFVDLPGYGYARGGRASADAFEQLTRDYFQVRLKPDPTPAGGRLQPDRRGVRLQADQGRAALVLLLVDARHPGLPADVAARRWLASLGLEVAVVATKIDTLSKAARVKARREVETSLDAPVLPVSADTGEGMDDLWKLIVKQLNPPQASASPAP